jgi:anion-transporting  ArsA/GET3 family ATPase
VATYNPSEQGRCIAELTSGALGGSLGAVMDVATFAESSRLRIVIGKGGVGKTAVTCAMAMAVARSARRVLILELEGRPEIPEAFGDPGPLSYEPTRLLTDDSGGTIDARRVKPDDALIEYLAEHGMGRIAKRLSSSGVLDVVAGAIPGIRDVLVLGKIKQLVNEGAADLVLLDAPATGHAMTLLTSPGSLVDVARGGPVRHQADEVVSMLSDPSLSQVTLITLAEELPVTEAIEAAFLIEDKAGVALGPVIANRVTTSSAALARSADEAAAEVGLELDPSLAAALDEAASFVRHRAERCETALERLRHELPLEVLVLPELDAERLGPQEINQLADAFVAALEGVEP